MKHLLVVLSLIATLTGCSDPVKHYMKSDVAAVFYHERNKYSVLIREGDELVSKTLPSGHMFEPRVFTDVPAGKSSWIEYEYMRSEWHGIREGYAHIHIHSVDEISGASWNHGKFGSGMTSRVD